jgi:hypothetical protein
MDSEIYSFALRTTLNEIQNLCPDIKNSFIFREDGEVVAGDGNTPEKTIVRVIDSFDGILEKAEALGGVEGITLESSKGRVNVCRMNGFYLVTVTMANADKNYVNTITRVLFPTVLKLVEKINSAPFKNESREPEPRPEIHIPEAMAKPAEEMPIEEPRPERPTRTLEPETKPKLTLPEPQINQLIVENIGGLLVPSDTVRIDNETLLQWQELYEDRKIEEAEIETFGGQSTRVKIKPIKDSKFEGKGIVQMPEKIQNVLEIRKGELVRVKPVIE